MRFAKLLVASMIVSYPAFAANNGCDGFIRKMKDLQQKFEKLRYEDQGQREQGFNLDESAIRALDEFRSVKGICRPVAWKAFVELARAQSPFDMEAQGSEFLVRYLKDQNLNRIYIQTVRESRVANECRNKLLENQVALRLCGDKPGCDERYSFNYPKCIGMEELPSKSKRSK